MLLSLKVISGVLTVGIFEKSKISVVPVFNKEIEAEFLIIKSSAGKLYFSGITATLYSPDLAFVAKLNLV